jgi:cytochrome c-type biogenesis protein CcmH/NrfF
MIKVRAIAMIVLLAMSAIALLVTTTLGAQQLSDRSKQVGMKIKCMCRGCDMSAAGCSHPGGAFSGMCDTAKAMLKEVDQHIAKGETDEEILQVFVQEFGSQVYTEPPKSGFSLVAWVLPSVYLFVGGGVVILVISRWRKHPIQQMSPARGAPGISAELLERARAQAARETQD